MYTLYTAPTPNGWKASIMLEEIGADYDVHPLRLGEGDQKQDWYRALNPNARIPTLVDHDEHDFVVFESGAILEYLADKSGQLMPADRKGRSQVVQWLMFQMGGLGPMQGQANVFFRYAPERIPYAIERYQNETKRLYRVLDRRLADHEYLAGDYSIADIAHWAWASIHFWAGVAIDDLPNLQRWLTQVGERDAVQRGAEIPEKIEFNLDNADEATRQAASMLVSSDDR